MKPFDLESAKAGHPVQTRDGHKARIICFDKKDNGCRYPIVALISEGTTFEDLRIYATNGEYVLGQESQLDLMMKSVKKEGWININHSLGNTVEGIFKSEKEAFWKKNPDCYTTTIKIEWEE